jgi:hypothetical protein
MLAQAHALYIAIVACEVAFWVILLLSLIARFILHRPVASRWLLLSLPLIDVALLGFTALDLRAGRTATLAHGLAAVYVGFTVAFGSTVVRWADERFAHRFAAGPTPTVAPSTGWRAVRFELELWLRCIAAWVMALGLLAGVIGYLGNSEATQPLLLWFRLGLGCVFFWFVFGPAWSLVFFRRRQSDAEQQRSGA